MGPGKYHIYLKQGVPIAKFLKKFGPEVKSGITRRMWAHGDRGFTGVFDEETVKALYADPEVRSVDKDGMLYIHRQSLCILCVHTFFFIGEIEPMKKMSPSP